MTETYEYRDAFTNGRSRILDKSGKLKKDAEDIKKELELLDLPDSMKETLRNMYFDLSDKDFSINTIRDDMLLWIARDSIEAGVEYMELSDTALSNSKRAEKYIQSLDRIIPLIEERVKVNETGKRIEEYLNDGIVNPELKDSNNTIKLRFLAGISRLTSYQSKFDNCVETIKQSAKSKWITGVDFLGEEGNKTSHFQKPLEELTRYAITQNPNFTIRIHAGETNTFDENIIEAMEIVYGEYLKSYENGEKPELPNVRIGHGIYGIKGKNIEPDSKLGQITERLKDLEVFKDDINDSEEITLMIFLARTKTIVECNLTSNIRLGNKTALKTFPMREYIEKGMLVIFSTDGSGTYGTDMDQELRTALLYGLVNGKNIEKIREIEQGVINRWTDENIENEFRKNETNDNVNVKENEARIDGKFKTLDILDRNNIIDDIGEKKPIVVAGGSFTVEEKQTVFDETQSKLDSFVRNSDPSNVSFVIGHTLRGEEGLLLEIINIVNEERRNTGQEEFDICAVVPKVISETQAKALQNAQVKCLISEEELETKIYKTIDSKVFSKGKASLFVYDSAHPAKNLVSDARRRRNIDIEIQKNLSQDMEATRKYIENDKVSSFNQEIGDIVENTPKIHFTDSITQEPIQKIEDKTEGVLGGDNLPQVQKTGLEKVTDDVKNLIDRFLDIIKIRIFHKPKEQKLETQRNISTTQSENITPISNTYTHEPNDFEKRIRCSDEVIQRTIEVGIEAEKRLKDYEERKARGEITKQSEEIEETEDDFIHN